MCLVLSLGIGRGIAQTDAAPESLDRPPVAAPTSKIQVGAIPIVLSASQEIENFAAGPIQGLLTDGRGDGVAVLIVPDHHTMPQRQLRTSRPATPLSAP